MLNSCQCPQLVCQIRLFPGTVSDEAMTKLLRSTCDLTPGGIIRKLQLRRPIYAPTAAEGHFGVADRPWEQTDLAEKLKELAGI